MTVVLKGMGNSRRSQILRQLADGSENQYPKLNNSFLTLANLPDPNILADCAAPTLSAHAVHPRQYTNQLKMLMLFAFSGCYRISMLMTLYYPEHGINMSPI